MKKPIFVIGVGRSGSVMLMNVLNNHSEIFIDNEINFRFPYKKCVYSEIKKAGDLRVDNNAINFIDKLYKGTIPNAVPVYGDIPYEVFKNEFLSSKRKYKNIFELLIKLKCNIKKKRICGAKFPIHFSYLKMLLNWYPDTKIIFLTRDPRAVYHSELKAKKKYTSARQYPISDKNPLFKLSVIFYVAIQWVWAQKIFNKYKNNYNLHLLKYEDLVSSPDEELKKLCNFLEVEYTDELLNIPVANSSFKGHITKGFNINAIHRWKNEMKNFDRFLINIITKKQRKKIGY